ncbi:Aste57867_11231 [Aphanomyces stellatus]|uniref:Aste57867_11231 protein n=1 Tax=Aphanomyces stellatus TaxID=120398 RepID=A0A485KSC6_9STRA|nr:hypothetical protein As57867_011189 [Aphanomyces stellatus]VFT88097.1 Aste57867_11231 [Aphanomyces stellatus]
MSSTTPTISAEGFLADGSDNFHEMLAKTLETASGKSMPQIEVRFKDFSLAADVAVANKDGKEELPTLWNFVVKSVMSLSKNKRIVHKDIVHPVSGVFKPATMTLLLGQPSSGKSSLMQMLAGRFGLEKNIQLGGTIAYNGTRREDVAHVVPQFVSYINQRDYHFPTLTTRETLEFGHLSCGGKVPQRVLDSLTHGTPEENAEAKHIVTALYDVYPDVIVQQLGLANCKDTIVGNAMLRGVSGGERKRVTVGEMEFGMKQVSLMDEISTGLDSAATYDIVKSQRSMAKCLKKTIVIALLQPSPEVFDQFDDVMIMNEGYVIYHGPRSEAKAYFESFGFHCPPGRDTADFLLDIGTRQQDLYVVPGRNVPRYPADYAALWRQSALYRQMMDYVEGPTHPLLLHDATHHMKEMPEFQNDFRTSLAHLVARQMKVTLRNTAFVKARLFMIVVMGLIYATTFYQVDPNEAQVVYGVIFLALLFLALGQVALIPNFVDARAIFYKQRSAQFYRTIEFVLAQTVTQFPFAVGEAVVFGSIMYWISGFTSNVGAFLIYELILLMTNVLFAAWFFFVAVAAPNLHIAKPIALLSVLFFVLYAGFIIIHRDIPDYLVWIYWINPLSWAMRALAVNQYTANEFQQCVYDGVKYCRNGNLEMTMGNALLDQFDIKKDKYWIWLCVAYLAAMYIFFVFISYLALEYIRYDNHHEGVHVDDHEAEEEAAKDAAAYNQLPPTPLASQQSQSAASAQMFVPVTLAFNDLHYFVPNPTKGEADLELLKGVSGYALPGTVTALMGSSGAGKTTLMDVIAGRKTGGKIVGDILLNGYPASDLAIRRCTGYCEQMDIHCESATFREALTFSSMLRQSSEIPTAVKMAHVDHCIDLLELHNIENSIIRGSSVEQMKRLTIGVELAAAPSVLFLDEPTSGLDARSAKIIMTGIRKIASTGRTVVCTIHQPSTEVFEMFDNLLLLKRGGRTVFFGELGAHSSKLIEYFSRLPGTPAIQDGANPATWMLEVIGAGVSSHANATDYSDLFADSPEAKRLTAAMAIHTTPRADLPEMTFNKKRAATEGLQCAFLIQRFMRMYWRTPSYNLVRVVLSILLALLFGLTYCSVNYGTYHGAIGGIGMIFSTTLFVGIISFNSVIPLASEERASFYRERASQTYNALWYWVGSTVAEIPYVFLTTYAFTLIFYPFVGFKGNVGDVLFYGFNMSLHVLLNVYMGQFMAYSMPRVDVAATMGILMNSIFFNFMGFNPPTAKIPSGYKWLYHANPFTYSLAVMVAQVFSKCKDGTEMACEVMQEVPPSLQHIFGKENITIKELTEAVFNMKDDHAFRNTMVIIGCIIFFRLLALLALRYVNHQKR